ncbi:MAG: hypothetical protein ABIK28_23265 [Planctomycetota bacterium]
MDVHDQWNGLAEELGFKLSYEVRSHVELPMLHRSAAVAVRKGKIHRAERMLKHPIMMDSLTKTYAGSASGFYRDFEFAIFRSSPAAQASKPVYDVNIVLLLRSELMFGLEIKRTHFLTPIIRTLFPGSYVRIPGNRKLDRIVAVKARDKTEIRKILPDTSWQEKLLNLFRFSRNFLLTDRTIRFSERAGIIKSERAIKIMDLMVDVAEFFPATSDG